MGSELVEKFVGIWILKFLIQIPQSIEQMLTVLNKYVTLGLYLDSFNQ